MTEADLNAGRRQRNVTYVIIEQRLLLFSTNDLWTSFPAPQIVTPSKGILMTHVFDETSRLRSDGNHVWVGLADPRQEATAGMYGGWTAALRLRAVLSDAIDQGSPSTLTVHFIKAITPGSEVKIRTQDIGGGRSLSIWQAEVQVAGKKVLRRLPP
jgi:hypothetical protein